jgi:hypothetical protein
MAFRSADDPSHEHTIIEFVPRQRVHHCVIGLLAALAEEDETGKARRLIAEADITFGETLVVELQRIVGRGPQRQALAAIQILLMLATDAAQMVLAEIGHDKAVHPLLRLEALRGLRQQGADVPIGLLVDLANQAERGTFPRDLP